ncbi:uncharacterized protein DFE_1745 [Desulfovibrio ferrophilus]|uniref:Uncharacterized protein n=1 Tax=Desulfovibrio ferrophilus TaxID=241368 RepID=A0A2Z6AYX6_9BACT|nr:uncharacterized protein DFE_1745 [Desulfovibrio ferrophilus]
MIHVQSPLYGTVATFRQVSTLIILLSYLTYNNKENKDVRDRIKARIEAGAG